VITFRALETEGVRRPPLPLILVTIAMLALGETAGALLSPLRPAVERYARARVAANAATHGLIGSLQTEYNDEVRDRAVFTAEAGLSFFHTHASGLAPLILLAGTIVASVISGVVTRRILQTLLTAGALFPLGYLAYALAALEMGRDAGVALAERYVLTPLGTAAILALVALACILGRAGRVGQPTR
jgi:hypothetical protein